MYRNIEVRADSAGKRWAQWCHVMLRIFWISSYFSTPPPTSPHIYFWWTCKNTFVCPQFLRLNPEIIVFPFCFWSQVQSFVQSLHDDVFTCQSECLFLQRNPSAMNLTCSTEPTSQRLFFRQKGTNKSKTKLQKHNAHHFASDSFFKIEK